MRKQLHYEVGMAVRAAHGVESQGGDGTLWYPKKRVAAVTDEVGNSTGKGMEDLNLYQKTLKRQRDVREAFFSLFGKGHSTITSLEFPEFSGQKGTLLYAGDSPCMRLRDSELEVLTIPEHNLWGMIEPQLPQILREMRKETILKLSKKETDELLELIAGAAPPNEKWTTAFLIHMAKKKPRALINIKRVMSNQLRLCLKTQPDRKEIKSMNGNGKGKKVSVKPGDRFLLCTDGIGDVFELEEMRDKLSQKKSSQETADNIMRSASSQRKKAIKNDDKALVIVDVK